MEKDFNKSKKIVFLRNKIKEENFNFRYLLTERYFLFKSFKYIINL